MAHISLNAQQRQRPSLSLCLCILLSLLCLFFASLGGSARVHVDAKASVPVVVEHTSGSARVVFAAFVRCDCCQEIVHRMPTALPKGRQVLKAQMLPGWPQHMSIMTQTFSTQSHHLPCKTTELPTHNHTTYSHDEWLLGYTVSVLGGWGLEV